MLKSTQQKSSHTGVMPLTPSEGFWIFLKRLKDQFIAFGGFQSFLLMSTYLAAVPK